MPTPIIEDLQPYEDAGWTLIPLHKYDAVDEVKGKLRTRGKSPLHKNWTKRPYQNKHQHDYMAEQGGNVGVRLLSHQLVVDVDPRHFPLIAGSETERETLDGPNPFARLCADCGIDPDDFPTVETGSGGLHVYMLKPKDVSIRDSLPDYPGVEFKTLGRQVVSAGSLHPDTHRPYTWSAFADNNLKKCKDAPDFLVNVIRRPIGAAQAAGGSINGGEYDPEEIATMLAALNPEDFQGHDDWLTLMQACHHASAGEARLEFVDWSTSDPMYSDHGQIIGTRWDSLHADKAAGRVTFKTLLKIMHDKGAAEAIPRVPAEDDFADMDVDLSFLDDDVTPVQGEGSGGGSGGADQEAPKHEEMGPLEKLNAKYWVVMDNGKCRIMSQQKDPTFDPPRKYWSTSSKTDFIDYYANRKVQMADQKQLVSLGAAWFEWGRRRTAQGVIFDPETDHKGGFLNLWTGWGVTPRKKDSGWGYLDTLIRETLCDGDMVLYEYVLNWCAHLVQHPGRPAEVAICFQGDKGTGKGTLGRALAALAGRHGLAISSSEHLTGRFNSHLRDVVLLFSDEAIAVTDHAAESRLKALITEPVLSYEGKGANLVAGKNHLHIIMASNNDWFVPMSLGDERRFVLQRVSNNRRGDKKFFTALNNQLFKEGGLEAMLWDLLRRDLNGWSPRDQLPVTRASLEQAERSMGPVGTWWVNKLNSGDIGIPPASEVNQCRWDETDIRLFTQDFKDDFSNWCRANGIRLGSNGRANDMQFADELKKLVPSFKNKLKAPVPDERPDIKADHEGRANCVLLPSLEACRAFHEERQGGQGRWHQE